jgi:hypothetical protein
MVAHQITSEGEHEASKFVIFITYLAQVRNSFCCLFLYLLITNLEIALWTFEPVGSDLSLGKSIIGGYREASSPLE